MGPKNYKALLKSKILVSDYRQYFAYHSENSRRKKQRACFFLKFCVLQFYNNNL